MKVEARQGTRHDLLQIVSGNSLHDQVLELDGKHFIGCTFSNCTLEYSGQPVVIETTRFSGCRFRFRAEAALTVQLLECFGILPVDGDVSYVALPSATSRQQLPN